MGIVIMVDLRTSSATCGDSGIRGGERLHQGVDPFPGQDFQEGVVIRVAGHEEDLQVRSEGSELVVVTLWEEGDDAAVPRRFTDALRRDDHRVR